MAILLDANILLRQTEPGHVQHQASVEATDALRRRGEDLVIVPQVLYEFWSVATRPIAQNGLGMSPAEAHAELIAIKRLFRLLRDERTIYAIWEQLVSSLGVRQAGTRRPPSRCHAAPRDHSHSDLQRRRFCSLSAHHRANAQ